MRYPLAAPRPTGVRFLSRAVCAGCLLALLAACAQKPRPLPPAAKTVTPELYGAGLFTTGAWDFFLAFSPDQRRVLFGRADPAFQSFELFETRRGEDGSWSAPVKPRFARQWSNADPHVSPDGRTVFFISNRPLPGEHAARNIHDAWAAHLQEDGEWGEAQRLPAPVNQPGLDVWSPAVAASGNLYFGGERPGTRGGSDLWVSRLVGGVYQPAENLGDGINSGAHELEPWISPDERYLLFSALRRPDGLGGYDLYLSRRLPDGTWGRAQPLPAGINSSTSDYNHSVSPDGAWLYFSSTRPLGGTALGPRFDVARDEAAVQGIGNGQGDIYRVPMRALGL